ncbi:MAG: hypothetical protein KF886_25875, partial [Candidatus Hydrogenedentes bacterium]|nr:hypothetical protein [Candidatus Hydrogenedentota bacterium]
MGSTIEIESKNLEMIRLSVVRDFFQTLPFFGMFLFMLAAVALYVYSGDFQAEGDLDVRVLLMLLFFAILTGGFTYIVAKELFLRVEETGVRNLHPWRGLIRTPWCYIRVVDLGGLRCRLEDVRDDRELGTVHLGDYVCPTDVFDTIAVNLGFKDTDEGRAIHARIASLLTPRPPYLHRILIIGWILYCIALLATIVLTALYRESSWTGKSISAGFVLLFILRHY